MLIRLPLVALLLLVSTVLAVDDPVVSTHWAAQGFTDAKPGEEDFSVTVTYQVPGVVKDSDTRYFKRFWSKVEVHASGIESEWRTGEGMSFTCRDGLDGNGCNGSANVRVDDNGLRVTLDLTWSGKQSGCLRRKFPVAWSELDKTIKDDEVEIHVAVRYRKV